MATSLFITLKELKANTALNGNVDPNKLLPALKIAQELEIEPILGTDLYNRISNDIANDTLSGSYLTLKNDYIHSILIHSALYYYLPYASYQISNGGVAKWNGGDNFDAVDTGELSLLTNKEKGISESFKQRLLKHLCNNSNLYPEYTSNTGEDITPNRNTNQSGLFLNY